VTVPGAVAVTGATGFLGSHVCDTLLAGGVPVRAAARATSDHRWLAGKDLTVVETALDEPASLDALLDGCRGVIHCAGVVMADAATYQAVNVDGTAALLDAARRTGTVSAFVLVSSLAAGGPAGLDHPRDETLPDAPVSGYGRSKLAAESLLTGGWPFRTVSLRPPSLYGPRDREFLPLLRGAARGWTARLGRQLQGLSLVDGRDAARAALALLEADRATGVYHLDDGPGPDGPCDPGRRWPWGYDWDELHAVLRGLFQRPVRRVTVPLPLLAAARRLAPAALRHRSPVLHPDRSVDLAQPGWVCTAARLRRDTGWQPRWDLASGLRDTLDFTRRRGWLR
jgi:nucleoside-diphosphate-sugar epimerase